jgi:hypothetical protein
MNSIAALSLCAVCGVMLVFVGSYSTVVTSRRGGLVWLSRLVVGLGMLLIGEALVLTLWLGLTT